MARLNKLKRNTKKTISMQSFVIKAFEYLDKQISKDLDQLKKYNKNYLTENCVGDNQLFYLYLRSEYPDVQLQILPKRPCSIIPVSYTHLDVYKRQLFDLIVGVFIQHIGQRFFTLHLGIQREQV